MKKEIRNICLMSIVIMIALAIVNAHKSDESATKTDIEQVKRELKSQIDSVLKNCDSLKSEIREIKSNTDTLKAGQQIIFKTMKENENKSLLDYIF